MTRKSEVALKTRHAFIQKYNKAVYKNENRYLS
jgi:hypothetical protein